MITLPVWFFVYFCSENNVLGINFHMHMLRWPVENDQTDATKMR